MNKVFFGDCRETMKRLIVDGVKVQTCVTSPPYWGLRDYGAEGQIGLERTPQEYVAKMVEVFGLVRDLLSDDGTLWLNLGDTYSTGSNGTNGGARSSLATNTEKYPDAKCSVGNHKRPPLIGLPSKNLIGIPWRVAFALQEVGWYLRSDIIWHKPNPMPESVEDRPTKSHEYLFLMSKNERYYYDAAAIKEPANGWNGSEFHDGKNMMVHPNTGTNRKPRVRNDRFGGNKHTGETTKHSDGSIFTGSETRNKRSVWTVSTVPFAGAHFAVFPPALIEPCIMAGSRPGDIVLDPFFGSGTTGQVAEQLGRQWIGCEIQTDYEPLQKQKTAQRGLAL